MSLVEYIIGEEGTKEVDKDEIAVQEQETLNADFLGSCLALAIYDPQREEAYLSHFPTIGNTELDQQLENYIEEVKEQTQPPYEVFLGGTMNADANPLQEEVTIREARKTAEEITQNYFSDQYFCEWSDGITRSRVVVNPEYGILYEEEVPEHAEDTEATIDSTFQRYLEP